MPIITEVMTPSDIDEVGAFTDIFQIGARNAQNYLLLEEVGKAGKPVMLKRGLVDADGGVAAGRGVRHGPGQPGRHPLRARHPHLRVVDSQHARRQLRAGHPGHEPPARLHRSQPRGRQAGARSGPAPWPASPPAPMG